MIGWRGIRLRLGLPPRRAMAVAAGPWCRCGVRSIPCAARVRRSTRRPVPSSASLTRFSHSARMGSSGDSAPADPFMAAMGSRALTLCPMPSGPMVDVVVNKCACGFFGARWIHASTAMPKVDTSQRANSLTNVISASLDRPRGSATSNSRATLASFLAALISIAFHKVDRSNSSGGVPSGRNSGRAWTWRFRLKSQVRPVRRSAIFEADL